ncbi:MAG: AMP-binding protein [Rhodocyclaceae bacterium]|nr:AMP-binding protein [Rhodocyclaceae bacterium]
MKLNTAAKNYDELFGTFRWNAPPRYNMARESLRGAGRRGRSRFALYYEDEAGHTEAWTFWDIRCRPTALSNVLHALGVMRRDRVAIILPQRPETGIAHIACYQMDAIALPLSHLFGPDALEYQLENSEASVAIVDQPRCPSCGR